MARLYNITENRFLADSSKKIALQINLQDGGLKDTVGFWVP